MADIQAPNIPRSFHCEQNENRYMARRNWKRIQIRDIATKHNRRFGLRNTTIRHQMPKEMTYTPTNEESDEEMQPSTNNAMPLYDQRTTPRWPIRNYARINRRHLPIGDTSFAPAFLNNVHGCNFALQVWSNKWHKIQKHNKNKARDPIVENGTAATADYISFIGSDRWGNAHSRITLQETRGR